MKVDYHFWQHSLKTRVVFTILAVSMVGVYSLLFYSYRVMHADIARIVGEQQFSAATYVAASINSELEGRIEVLELAARSIDAPMIGNPGSLRKLLEQRVVLLRHFNGGVVVVRPDGNTIVDVSDLPYPSRVGTNYSGNTAIAAALTQGKSMIGAPLLGRVTKTPLFQIVTPIRDAQGGIIGALVGVIDLSRPNFLDHVTQNRYGMTGGYLLISPEHKLFVTATDKSRILQPVPPPGINPMHDRYMQGFEGYGLAVNSRGVEELTAAKRIPVANWFIVAVLPTEEAFASANRLVLHLQIAALLLAMLAGALIWWMLRRQLLPLQETVEKLSDMTEGKSPLTALPVAKTDEIGRLVAGFNRLLARLAKREYDLQESESRFRQQFERHSASMLLIDPESGDILDANPAAERFYGYAQLRGMRIGQINTEAEEMLFKDRQEALHGQRNAFVFRHRLANGEVRTVEVYSSPIDLGGKKVLYSIINDITQRKRAEEGLQRQLRFTRALNSIAEAILAGDGSERILDETVSIVGEALGADRALIYDLDFEKHLAIGLGEYLNPRHPGIAPTKASYPLEVFIGGAAEMRRTRRWLTSHAADVNPHFVRDGSAEVLHQQMHIQSLLWYPFFFRDSGYHLLVLNQIEAPRVWDDQDLDFLASVSHQVSLALTKMSMLDERKRNEDRIKYLAHFDALTALPNKTQLEERLNYLLSLAKRGRGQLAVMFLDLDHFKHINDTLGHSAGDALLVEVAKRLKACMRDGDTISRQGGDEFILLLPSGDVQTVSHIAEKLLDAVAQPYQIAGKEMNVTPSIGIALYPGDGKDFEMLASNADAAMYRAKQEGRNCYRFFTAEMQTRSARMLQLGNALRHALENNEMSLHYQPQIDLESGRVIGAEALLRWRNAELGNVSPAEFIPVAEDNGLILPIGEWVLRSAVQQAKRWLETHLAPLVIAVNLSAVQFRHPSLPALVTRILDEAQLPPEYLELELTEGVAMHDPQAAIGVMNDLHERGVRMSIDDFGTGYSSLSYLKKFKVYKLKIDQSFVRDISTDLEDKAIVSAVINMAASLGLQTIAEGVETDSQLAYLREQGCKEVQGYYFSKPLPAADFERWVKSR
ncbi:MAG: EAL domain-containing protein [Gallionella sp.]|nr:EAL domain-containing protein [Gallionella sp.]